MMNKYVGFRRNPYLLIVVVLLLQSDYGRDGLYKAEKEFAQTKGSQWTPCLEWTVKNPSFDGNPFDVEARVEFTHLQTGRSVVTSMFYDGRDIWRFRFTRILTGRWSFQTSSKDEDLNGWAGKLVIEKNNNPRAHGFIKALGNKWGWQGTEEAFIPQYVMGMDMIPRIYGQVRRS